MTTHAELIEKLEAAHDFPCDYEFKLFGPNDDAFEAAARDKVQARFPGVEPDLSRRESAKANHQCITITLRVPDAETVVAFYAELRTIDRLKMML